MLVPYSFCMGCPIGCSDSCFYFLAIFLHQPECVFDILGPMDVVDHDACVRSCMSWYGWAPNTQVTITYFPYGEFSTGGCKCHGFKCA
jgi:hypothetical protein